MKNLPTLKWKTADAAQHERLTRWLRERELQLAMRAEEEPSDPIASSALHVLGPLHDAVAPFDSAPVLAGEIRLLSSRLLPGADRPVYVAVLTEWEDGVKLVAPFSALGEPATTTELRTEREAPALAVLCLWNSHTTPEELLARSWIVDQMSEQERADAWAVFQHAVTGKPIPESLSERIGLPILDADDPRLVYQSEEAALLAPLSDALLEAQRPRDGNNVIFLPALLSARKEGMQALAAATATAPTVLEAFEAPSVSAHLRIYLEADLSTATLLVHDREGEPTRALDGAVVMSSAGEPLATIADAFATFPIGPASKGISLRLPSGDLVPLIPR